LILLFPDDIDGGNEADLESGEDPEISFDEELIVAYLNNPDYNNSANNGNEWVFNDVNFDYSLCCDDVNSPLDMNPPHMPLPISTVCMHIEENDGSVFVVPSSKRDQLPIIFSRVGYWIEPPQFFYYARSAHCMMKEMGYDLHRGEILNFLKGPCIPLQTFVPEGKCWPRGPSL